MAEFYYWCKSFPTVFDYRDDEGKEYCVFHAPLGKKGITAELFNEMVFGEIKQAITNNAEKVCNLSGTIFDNTISFHHFNQDNPLPNMLFNDVVFHSYANFTNTHFSGVTKFINTKFHRHANFNMAIFKQTVEFSFANFFEGAIFSPSYFHGPVHFSYATFHDDVNFDNSLFYKEALFMFSKFYKVSKFIKTNFNCDAIFHNAKFYNKTSFTGFIANESARFTDSKFNGLVDFNNAKFNQGAYLNNIVFKNKSFFVETIILGETNFGKTVFHDDLAFDNVQCCGNVNFNEALFFSTGKFRGKTFFKNVSFENVLIKDKLVFEEVNLANTIFLYTDIRNIEFINCLWRKKYGRKVLFDEINIIGIRKLQWDISEYRNQFSRIEILYRLLKNKYKSDDNLPEISNWHYGEKEMYRKGNPLRRYFPISLSNLYWISSGYGEKPIRSGIILLILFLSITTLMAYHGLILAKATSVSGITSINNLDDIKNFQNIKAIILNTLQTVTFQKETLFVPRNDSISGEYIKIMSQILIPIQVALFALAVRNKFKR